MEMKMEYEEKVLTPRQQEALEQLKVMPIPSAPALELALLREPPWGYRFLTPGPLLIVGMGFLLLTLFVLPYATLPESWLGPVVLKSGSAITLAAGKNCEIQLPRSQGICILQGPAHLAIDRISRNLLTGQMEAALKLSYGDLFLKVDPAQPKRIQIQTPLLWVRITGTELLVGHRPQDGSRVWVMRGTVWMKLSTDSGNWEPLMSGMEYATTPAGSALRKSYSSEESFPPLPENKQEEKALPLNITGLLWHEETRR